MSNMVDPTVLTTQMTQREIAGVREFFDAKNEALKDVIHLGIKNLETRFNGMDIAIGLVRIAAEHMVISTDEKIKALREVHEEKFASIQTQFKERDTRSEQNAKDTKVAVDAALQAAEKAVGKQQEAFGAATDKSEATTTKQIQQIADLLRQGISNVGEQIGDIKERLTRLEGRNPAGVSIAFSGLAFLVALTAIVVAIVVRH